MLRAIVDAAVAIDRAARSRPADGERSAADAAAAADSIADDHREPAAARAAARDRSDATATIADGESAAAPSSRRSHVGRREDERHLHRARDDALPAERDVQPTAAADLRVRRRHRVSREGHAARGHVHRGAHGSVPAQREVQGAAAGALPEVTTFRAREEWRARIAAEYTSAAITQQVMLWLIQAGAPPELIDAGLAIVADELAHSRLSHEVYTAAGGTAPPALVREHLGLPRRDPVLELESCLSAIVRVFCLGETVAVPLFKPPPRAVHRAGRTHRTRSDPRRRSPPPRLRLGHARLARDDRDRRSHPARGSPAQWPALHGELVATYGTGNPATTGDHGDLDHPGRTRLGPAPRRPTTWRSSRELLKRITGRGFLHAV